jgi:hypothetical protein
MLAFHHTQEERSMHKFIQYLVGTAAVIGLAACGGGGGSSPAPATTPDNSFLTFSPASISLTAARGASLPFSVTATSSRTFSQRINIGIIDRNGLITTDVQVVAQSALVYTANMKTNGTLQPGSYTTTLEVRLCEDDPVVCNTPISGSPWRLPMSLTVSP